MSLDSFCQQLGTYVSAHNGTAIAILLQSIAIPISIKTPPVISSSSTVFELLSRLQYESQIEVVANNAIAAPYASIFALHIRSLYKILVHKQFLTAFEYSSNACEQLYTVMENEKEANWILPFTNSLLLHLRFLSYASDDILGEKGEKQHYMIETQDLLKKFLQKMVVDRAPLPVSKRMGCLFILTHLFKIYFRLNNLKMCTYLIKMVQMLPPLSSYPMSQQVTYQFYYGRLMLFEEQYEKAEEALRFAFQHCHRNSSRNKRRLLTFLIPISLLFGRYPAMILLRKYKLMAYEPLIRSVRRGDLLQFQQNLEKHADELIRQGVYLILEKLKMHVYRNLFRIVHTQIHTPQTQGTSNPIHQLPLSLLLSSLSVMGKEMDMDELECILANLIYAGQMKGYIAHHRCVVLSKQDPFPSFTPSAALTS